MSNYPWLSIIVPVYNTEKYISRCIETIVSQSMNDYELIIINDASTDKSDEIIKKRISGLKNAKYYVLKKISVSVMQEILEWKILKVNISDL